MTVFFNKIQISEVLYRENNHTNLMLNGFTQTGRIRLSENDQSFLGVHHIITACLKAKLKTELNFSLHLSSIYFLQ